jgi:hypothetical protein
MNRAIGVLGAASTATAMFIASGASGDFIGWTSTRRVVTGGYLYNVFAVTNNSSDLLLNVSGGSVGLPTAGFITTNSTGGFLQGTGTQSVFAPAGSQNWTTLDSFLTVGGGFNTTTNAWLGNGNTQGDPPWNVTYADSDTGEATTVSSFNTQNNASGFINPNVNSIPVTAGWFIAGSASPARSLASISGIRNFHVSSAGGNFGASSYAASVLMNGFMVAQFFVANDLDVLTGKYIDWKMGASLRRADGTISNGSFEMRIQLIPAAGAIGLFGLLGISPSCSRRRTR